MEKIDFKKMVLRKAFSHRGGGIEISLDSIGRKYKGFKMSAYQNYLGGDMVGRIASDCTMDDWKNDKKLVEVSKQLQRYFYDLYYNVSDAHFNVLQTRPVSAY